MKRRIIAIMAAVSLMTFGLVGCGSESPQSADAAEQGKNEESVELNGTIKLAGSTSMEKLCGCFFPFSVCCRLSSQAPLIT